MPVSPQTVAKAIRTKTWISFLAIFTFVSLYAPAVSALDKTDCVAKYLTGAERQFETEEQKAEIKRALNDMLSLKPAALLKKRYCDYQMHPNRWTAVDMLHRYFVPESRVYLNPDCFKASSTTAAAKKAISKHLHDLTTAR